MTNHTKKHTPHSFFTYLCRNSFFEYGRRNIIQSNLLFMNAHYMQGGGNSRAYTAPRMETLEVSAEKGFAASSDITGDDMFGGAGGNVPDDNGSWW